MALTNFGDLTQGQKTTWARDLMKEARRHSFIMQFAGTGHNSIVQRVTELTKSERGTRAVVSLLNNLVESGIMGDNDLEGNEEQLKARDIEIKVDQIRHANRIAGRIAEQKTIVNFRQSSRDVLAYWLSDMLDSMAFHTLSGVNYRFNSSGKDLFKTAASIAGGRNLEDLEFATTLLPSADRHVTMTAAGVITENPGVSPLTGVVTDDLSTEALSYKGLVNLKALAKDSGIRGVRTKGGDELYHMFVGPQGMAQLKLDADFLANARNAGVRGDSNIVWSGGTSVMIDGIVVHETQHCIDSKNAVDFKDNMTTVPAAGETGRGYIANVAGSTSDTTFAAATDLSILTHAGDASGGGTTPWQRSLFCGAQALAMADLGAPYWDEDKFDYNNQLGISTGKIVGFAKPQFKSTWHDDYDGGAARDYGVIAVDTAL